MDYINAHATSTPAGNLQFIYILLSISVSPIKSHNNVSVEVRSEVVKSSDPDDTGII